MSAPIPIVVLGDRKHSAGDHCWLAGARTVQAQEVEKFADLMIALRGVPHGRTEIERVVIAPSLSLAGHVASHNEIRDDPLRGALRYPHGLGDLAQPRPRVALYAEKHLCVTRDKTPRC